MRIRKEDYPNYDQAEYWARYLCYRAGKDLEFLKGFWRELLSCREIYEEFVYYMEHQEALGAYTVEGYSLVDILVYQIDHFRAVMDREPAKIRDNREQMILMAFDTLLKMRKEPERYLEKLRTETGTDMPR